MSDAILDALSEGVVLLDASGRIVKANGVARRILGPGLDSPHPRLWASCCGLFDPDGRAPVSSALPPEAVLQGAAACEQEFMVRRTDLPGELWIRMKALPGEGGGVVCFLQDLTEFRQRERKLLAALAHAEETLRKFIRGVEQSPACVVITDAEGRIEYVNPKFTELTGYAPEEVYGRNPRVLKSGHTPPEEYKRLWETILAGGQWCGEFLNRKKNGELYWEWARISPVHGPDGTITHFIAVKEDITERKRFDREIQQVNQRLRAVIETCPLAICTLDSEGKVTSWNGAAQRIFGWAPGEVLGQLLPVIPEDFSLAFWNAFEEARRGRSFANLQGIGRHKDGRRLELEVWGAPLSHPESGDGVLVLFADVTQRKWLEEQLRQAQKMEALGRLAGGVAHDFNNLLTIISGYGELLLAQVEEPLREDVRAILESAERATAVTRQLLALSRRQASQPRVVDLNAIIRGMEKIIRRALGEHIALELSLRSSLWPIKADPSQLEQILLNLAVNARDAMPQGGRLVIATTNCARTETAALGLPPGHYVRLTVRDTGEGLDPETCRRIFEPFFSTKPTDKGTGLGLAIVYGIVKQGGGEIFVDSRRGEGTVFTIYLPRASGIPESHVAPAPAPPKAERGETILLVEDEDAVRRLVRDMLVRHGYAVLEAADGERALQLFERHAERIALLLTDVVMPGMSGRELAARVRARRPELKVVYMSGYTGDALGERGGPEPGITLIQKPFTPRTLLRRLREALTGPNPRS
ncbi:MAG: PAS domain S-box protein [Bryobacterales bacterium]|nr:PAS domain S-box protein [Bryobacteraceae bacterium]MDW8129380.1 PAS domain S-box protein [Bryobacterales bacterium]